MPQRADCVENLATCQRDIERVCVWGGACVHARVPVCVLVSKCVLKCVRECLIVSVYACLCIHACLHIYGTRAN